MARVVATDYYESGTTPLSLAASGHIEIVEMLLAAGAYIDVPGQDGSPLMMAV